MWFLTFNKFEDICSGCTIWSLLRVPLHYHMAFQEFYDPCISLTTVKWYQVTERPTSLLCKLQRVLLETKDFNLTWRRVVLVGSRPPLQLKRWMLDLTSWFLRMFRRLCHLKAWLCFSSTLWNFHSWWHLLMLLLLSFFFLS